LVRPCKEDRTSGEAGQQQRANRERKSHAPNGMLAPFTPTKPDVRAIAVFAINMILPVD